MQLKLPFLKLFVFCCGIAVWSCNPSGERKSEAEVPSTLSQRERAVFTIDSLEGIMKKAEQQNNSAFIQNSLRLAEAYQFFQLDFPEDTLSPKIALKEARLFDAILADQEKALRLYNQVQTKYPSAAEAPIAQYFIGNLHHDRGDTAKAADAFRMFISKYPEHPYVNDAREMLKIVKLNKYQLQDYLQKKADQQSGS